MAEKSINRRTITEKTGRSLEDWTDLLDKAGFREKPHRDIASYLNKKQGLSAWWAQEVTVEYEKTIGRRVTGQTGKTGFQLGVSRTFNTSAGELWNWLTSEKGRTWYSGIASEGIETEPRVLKDGSHLRLRWKMPGWTGYSTLQIRTVAKGSDKTTLTVHQEKLADQETREQMLRYWKEKMDQIETQWR